jgi:hypothetical protein
MIPAHSIESVLRDLNEVLGARTEQRKVVVPSSKIGLMIAGQPIQSFETRTVNVSIEQWSKLVGILFCEPTSPLGKEEITHHLEYFHYRSGHFVDFFCVGYGASPSSSRDQSNRIVARVEEVDWTFNAKDFNLFRAQLEGNSRWKYSGESDLVLLVARKSPKTEITLDFSTAIACNLELMQKDEAFSSVRAFFEQIFRFGETYQGSDPIWDLSDKMGLQRGRNFLLEAVLSLLPEATSKLYQSAKHYAIRDISEVH